VEPEPKFLLYLSLLLFFFPSARKQLVLNSMHRYQPRIHLVKWREGMMANGAFVSELESELFRTFIFPETVFTAVTAYQNQLVSKPTEALTPVPTSYPIAPTTILHWQVLGDSDFFRSFPLLLMCTTWARLLIAPIKEKYGRLY
jgi:hypothetical protein